MTAVLITPDGEMQEVDAPEQNTRAWLSFLYAHIDCELVELVQNSSTMPGFCVWFDEQGSPMFKGDDAVLNPAASWTLHEMRLWADGQPHGLFGPVVITGTHTDDDGDQDSGPLTDEQLEAVKAAYGRAREANSG